LPDGSPGRFARFADRAEAISVQRSHPITLLAESDETRRMTLAFDQMLDALEASERQRLTAERVAAWEEIAKNDSPTKSRIRSRRFSLRSRTWSAPGGSRPPPLTRPFVVETEDDP